MGWEIYDLSPLVICQVRNHNANDDFSLWSEEFMSETQSLAGAQKPLLPPTLKDTQYSISMNLVEAHVCFVCSVRELHFLELLIFLFAAKLSNPTALRADSIRISSSLKKLWIPLVPFLGQALTSLCLLIFKPGPSLLSSHRPQVPQTGTCLTAAIFPGTVFKGLSVTGSSPCKANLSLTLSSLAATSSLNRSCAL